MRIPLLSTPFSLSLLPLLATHILALPVGVGAAAPPSSNTTPLTAKDLDTHFTPDTFTPTIAKGLWFVEHYSPYCGHCKHFRPTWERLVVDAYEGVLGEGKEGGSGGEELKEVKMGSVDCAVHGDLCDANNIKGYPTLLMFHDGKIVDQFKGARELHDLKAFMKRHVVAARAEGDGAGAGAGVGDEKKQVVESVPGKDVKKAAKEAPLRKSPTPHPSKPIDPPNPSGEVLSIPPASFASTLSSLTSAGHPVFVKFFAPWCGHCKKLAPTWRALGKHMRGKVVVAEVDCEGAGGKGVCAGEGVSGYPTLVWYAGGVGGGDVEGNGETKKGMEYGQGRKLEQLKAFAEKASAAGVLPIDDGKDLEGWIAKEDVVYLLLHSDADADEGIVNKIRTASSPLLGSPQILSSLSPALFAKYSLTPLPSDSSSNPWKLLAFKDHDAIFPASIFHSSAPYSSPSPSSQTDQKTMEEAQRWMLTHRLPTSIELTRDTFQSVMNAPQKPIVVLAFSPAGDGSSGGEERMKEKVLERLRDVGRKWRVRMRRGGDDRENGGSGDEGMYRGREVVFAWMDEGRWGDWIKGMYGGLSGLSEGGGEGGEGKAKGAGAGLEGVRVVVADHSTLTYYPTDAQSHSIRFTSSASIFAAVEDALSGRTPYQHSEGVVERVARYLNAKMQSLELSVTSHPFRSVLILIGVLGGVFWMLSRFVGDGNGNGGRGAYERGREEWREVKGRSGRLD